MITPNILQNNSALPFLNAAEVGGCRGEFERIPGLPYTAEERIASVMRSEEDIAAGRVVSHEDMKKRIALWLSR